MNLRAAERHVGARLVGLGVCFARLSTVIVARALLFAAVGASLASSAEETKVAGRDVPPPRRTKFTAPQYPAEAQALGLRGIVILELIIDEEGKVASVDVIRSVPPFDEAAVSAVRKWEFEVTRVDGKPVRVRHTVPISFALKLPEMSSEPGIPELRAGVGPAFPPGSSGAQPASVTAEVTLDSQGEVAEAEIKTGGSPWAEALLQAIRTWRFVSPGSPAGISFRVEAQFVPTGKGAPRVDLRLLGLRHEPPSTAVTPPPGEPSAPPVTTQPSVPSATTTPEPAPSPPSTADLASPAHPAAATTRAPVEVVPAARPETAPPSPSNSGVSAIRDITLGPGVPTLAGGRRPIVPPFARMEGIAGRVEVRFSVDAGGVTRMSEVQGHELLREAARQTVESWTFRRTSAERLPLVAVFDYKGDVASATVSLSE